MIHDAWSMFHSLQCIVVDLFVGGRGSLSSCIPVRSNPRNRDNKHLWKKAVKESFQLKQIPKFASAVELKNYIVSGKVKAANVESMEIGYYGPPRGTRFAIIDETTLAEAYSTEKQEWVVIWVWTPPDGVANKRQSQSSTAVASSNAKRLRISSRC